MGYLSIVIRKKADCMDTNEVEGVDVLFGSFLFSHHGEWQAVEVQDEFVGNVLFSNLVRDLFDERVL